MNDDGRPLTDQCYWAPAHLDQLKNGITPRQPPWYAVLADLLPTRRDATCLEIGVFPGSTLLFLAKARGYHCTGIDFTPQLSAVHDAFSRHGVIPRLVKANFLEWSPKEQFDFVYSMGFVEHFGGCDEVIGKHWHCVAPGGLLVISLPVLSVYQCLVRSLVYTRAHWRQIKASHNRKIMSVAALRAAVSRLAGAQIVAACYLRQMDVEIDPTHRGVRSSRRRLLARIRRFSRMARRIAPSSRWYSPEAVIAVRRLT